MEHDKGLKQLIEPIHLYAQGLKTLDLQQLPFFFFFILMPFVELWIDKKVCPSRLPWE